jgi:hypothetical protein
MYSKDQQALGIIETQGPKSISTIQINARDGNFIRTYHCNNIEDSLESLMNL